MDIALTGANGFIGSIIKKNLLEDGHNVFEIRTNDKIKKIPEVYCLIHCARSDKNIFDNYGNLALNPTNEQWANEFKIDVQLAYESSMDFKIYSQSLENIIFISSIYGKIPPIVREIPMNYLTAKAAEIYLAKCLAVKFAPKVRVNTLILGGVESTRPAAQQTDDFKKAYANKTLINRMTKDTDIYSAIKLLIENKGMTGSEITITGGYGYV